MRGGNGGTLPVGTKPGRGMYLCNRCEQCITLDYDTEKLFECPNCILIGLSSFCIVHSRLDSHQLTPRNMQGVFENFTS
jgi:hypothetical protein